MTRFAPNFHHMFLELPVRERFAAAAKIGFDAVEWHFPYVLPAGDVAALLGDNGLEFTYGVVPADWAAGDFGLAGQPGRQDEFRRAADTALEYVHACDFYSINVGAGTVPAGEERARCVDAYIENIAWIADRAGDHRCRFLLEPVCEHKNPGWVFRTMEEAAAIVRAVGRDNVGLVYDTFHLRWQEGGPLAPIMDAYWDMIGYVQIGNAPGRHEPGVGEIDLLWLAERAVAKGYEGAIGMELDPSADTWTSLAWLNAYGYAVDPDDRPA